MNIGVCVCTCASVLETTQLNLYINTSKHEACYKVFLMIIEAVRSVCLQAAPTKLYAIVGELEK